MSKSIGSGKEVFIFGKMVEIKGHGRFPMFTQCQGPLKKAFSKRYYLEFVFVILWSRAFINYKNKFNNLKKNS